MPGSWAAPFRRMPEEERRAAVLGSFARVLGPAARDCVSYTEYDWTSDPWARGCYFGLAAQGLITESRNGMSRPTGLLHWAGAETSWEGFGGMEGAVVSGARAAREVARALGAGGGPGAAGGTVRAVSAGVAR